MISSSKSSKRQFGPAQCSFLYSPRDWKPISLGYGGAARLVLCDGNSAIYAYKCENPNKPINNPIEDGEMYLEFNSIASAYIPKRTKRYPKGVPITFAENVDYQKMLADGSLQVRNCSNCSRTGTDGIDIQAWTLIHKIALAVQRDGAFPEKVAYMR